jgi:hypothetical protein
MFRIFSDGTAPDFDKKIILLNSAELPFSFFLFFITRLPQSYIMDRRGRSIDEGLRPKLSLLKTTLNPFVVVNTYNL